MPQSVLHICGMPLSMFPCRVAFGPFATPTMVSDLPSMRYCPFALLLSFVDPLLYASQSTL